MLVFMPTLLRRLAISVVGGEGWVVSFLSLDFLEMKNVSIFHVPASAFHVWVYSSGLELVCATPLGIDDVPWWLLLRERRSDVREKASICLLVCWCIDRE